MKQKPIQNWDWAQLAEISGYRLSKMAELSGFSVRTLQRHFRCKAGLTPHQWVELLRVCKAMQVLIEGNSIKEAAWKLQFSSRSHFERTFAKWSGCTPTEFLKEHEVRQAERKRYFEELFPNEHISNIWRNDPLVSKPWDFLLQVSLKRNNGSS